MTIPREMFDEWLQAKDAWLTKQKDRYQHQVVGALWGVIAEERQGSGVVDGYFEWGMDQRVFAFCIRWKREKTWVSPFEETKRWCGWWRWSCMRSCPQPSVEISRVEKQKVSDRQLSIRPVGHKVYFAQDASSGEIKIGTSKQVGSRVAQVAKELKRSLTVVATINGNREVEQILHQRFAGARIRGEWFRPVPELLAYIAGIKAAA